MDRALRLLLVLHAKSLFRQLKRLTKTLRGKIVLLMLVIAFASMLLAIMATMFAGGSFKNQNNLQSIENYLALGLCITTVLQLLQRSGSHGIYFSPSEIENLFAAPFSRRQLLFYKLFVEFRQAILSSVMMIFCCSLFLPNLICGITGVVLLIAFGKFLPILFAILGQTANAKIYDWRRKLVGYAIVLLLGWAMVSKISSLSFEFSQEAFDHWLVTVSESWLGGAALFPFKMFARTATSKSIDLEFGVNAAACVFMNLSVVAAILWGDANYFSVVHRTSSRKIKQLKQLQFGAFKNHYRFTLPMLPFAGGVGPLVWRQTLATIRTSGYFVPVAIMMGIALIYSFLFQQKNVIESDAFPPVVLSALAYVTLLMALVAPLGFKPDIQRMENLKLLPFSDWAIVVGQLAAGTLIASLIQISIIALIAIFNSDRVEFWLISAASIFPINYVAFAASSIVLVLFPVRTGVDGATSLASVGHAMLSMLSLTALCLVALGVVVGFAAVALFLSGDLRISIIVGVTSVALAAALLTWLLVFVYRRFDVSQDSPG